MELKIAFFIIVISVSNVFATPAYSQVAKVSLNMENKSLEQVMDEIEHQTEFYFIFNQKQINVNRVVSIQEENKLITDILPELFKGTNVNYAVFDRKILLTTDPLDNNLLAIASVTELQQKQITGTVTDKNGAPLTGVNVVLTGTTVGAITDIEGKYIIEVSSGAKSLTFSFVGMVTQDVNIGTINQINISLDQTEFSLDEVVIVAYGKSQKSTLTSSVSSIKAEKMAEAPVANISSSLPGRVAGILTVQGSGEPGLDAPQIQIRGFNTTGKSTPLVIIDGIPGSMDRINPSDIESISVLKDAAAVAPYGLAAANGVILLTTKKGSRGEKPKFSYNANYAIQNPTYIFQTANSHQYALIQNEIYKNDNPTGTTPPWSEADLEGFRKVVEGDPTANTDKYYNSRNVRDIIRHNYPLQNHSISVQGGSQQVSYYANLGYLNQASMLPNEKFERYTGVLNMDVDVNKTLKISTSVKLFESNKEVPSYSDGQSVWSILGLFQAITPVTPIFYPNTPGYWSKGAFDRNPVGRIYTSGQRDYKINSSIYVLGFEQQLPLKGLSVKGTFNYGHDSQFDDNWNKDAIWWDVDNSVTPAVYIKREPITKPNYQQNYSRTDNMILQGFLNYDNTFGKHAFKGLMVVEVTDIQNKSFWAMRKNYSIPIHTLSMGSSLSTDLNNGGTSSSVRQAGYVAQVGYNYDKKYMIELSGRYDMHYYFAPGKRGGLFPSVSVGWRLGQEKFIKDNYAWIDELKVRASWGESGNLAGSPYQYMSAYGVIPENYRLNDALGTGLYEQSTANPNITWEKQKQTNIGVDLVFWNGSLSFSGDYFYQIRDNMLLTPNVVLPGEYGISLPQENAGRMSNQGFELVTGTKQKLRNGITFNVNANVSFARNKLLETFENKATYDDPNRRRTGNPLGARFGQVVLGYFQSEDEVANSPAQKFGYYTVGDVKYKDLNNDGVVDAKDETRIGRSGFPECIFGLDLGATWKGFDLNALIQGATLVDAYAPGPAGPYYPGYPTNNTQIEFLDHWTPETPNALYPRYSNKSINNNYNRGSDLRLRDGTYIRLKSFNIGYTLPRQVLDKINIELLRFYISGQNMLTWTKDFLNVDPETTGINSFAMQKSIALGVNLTF